MSGNTMGTCPSDAEWWTCIDQSPTFLGCCASNACNGIGCPSDDLRAAGLGTACGTNSDSNDSSYWPYVQCSSGGQWWTCESPSFQGCCDINPCGGGCPANDLHPAAFLYDASATSAASELGSCSPSGMMDIINSLATSSMRVTPYKQSLTITSAATAISTNIPTPNVTPSRNKNNAAIAGGAAGGAVVLILIAVAIFWRYCRQRKRWVAVSGHTVVVPETFEEPTSPYEGTELGWRLGQKSTTAYCPCQIVPGVPHAKQYSVGSPQLSSLYSTYTSNSAMGSPRTDLGIYSEVSSDGRHTAELQG